MSAFEPLSAVTATSGVAVTLGNSRDLLLGGPITTKPAVNVHFGELLMTGVGQVEAKLKTADTLVRKFAVDDSVPVHQVTIALEEARLAVELAVQVRNKVVEGYRELMNMQL